MTRGPIALEDTATIGDAIAALAEHGCRHLPIVRRGQAVAVVSDRDLRRVEGAVIGGIEGRGAPVAYDALVTSIARGEPVTVALDAPAREAIDAMLHRHVSSVLVVGDDGSLAGIITTSDVLRAARDVL